MLPGPSDSPRTRVCRQTLAPEYASCPHLRRESQSGTLRESHEKRHCLVVVTLRRLPGSRRRPGGLRGSSGLAAATLEAALRPRVPRRAVGQAYVTGARPRPQPPSGAVTAHDAGVLEFPGPSGAAGGLRRRADRPGDRARDLVVEDAAG